MKTITPYQTIGIIGGGQLARMMSFSAKAMGYKVAVLDPEPNCPAGQVSDIEITAAYNDMEAIKKLASISDVITYEFENIDYEALKWLEENTYLPQGSNVLKVSQHRYLEKKTISDMGIRVAEFCLIDSAEALKKNITYPSVLKTTTLGYDGKGQIVLRSEADLPRALEQAANYECILEKFVPFTKEVSVIVARSTTGETAVFPVSENIHVNNILHQSIVPARISPKVEQEAIDYAQKIANNLNAIGLLAIEMFVVDESIVINEIAPRPHNSGHYTIDACVTSQFEQHVRAVCGLPLGATTLHTPVVMVNILGDHLDKQNMSNLAPYIPLLPNGKLHLYGKAEARDKRKMGHINLLGDINESLKAAAAQPHFADNSYR
ncbi:MAG: 5-(carboxyamino)imidazole ribonucleotide synthase [Defluviitaleaceae bacterium]|nr:5-(carboxyamino)imidazole ribonucleotide synthase [Defluviitaleaceae bacterium]